MPSVVRSARLFALTRVDVVGVVEKNHAHFIAARPNDLLAALNVMLLLTIALFGRLANGVYLFPLVTKSQWISSASTTTRLLQADLAEAHQIFRRPAVAGRVLRVAEDERVGVVADAALEILEVDRVTAVHQLHRAIFGLGPGGGEVAVEAVVGRRDQQDLGARRRERCSAAMMPGCTPVVSTTDSGLMSMP